jgi:tRNA(Ile)-lysidine synthase
VLRRAALAAGAPASDLSSGHVAAMDALVRGESGGMSVDLPGRVSAVRSGGRLHLTQHH